MPRRLAAELLGSAVLVAVVVGSGIMAVALTSDTGIQLLITMLATVAGLGVLICLLAPISGAHLNPAVTLIAALRRELAPRQAAGYAVAQILGAVCGVALANLMYSLPAWTASTHTRSGAGLWLGEAVATAGLLLVVGAAARTGRSALAPFLVPAWIGAAYFFTSSTSFANPAVTIGRALSDTFAGIAPASVPAFLAAQAVGAVLGAALASGLYPRPTPHPDPAPREASHGTS